MRILHFSDFHLRPGEAGERSFDLLYRMLDAISSVKNQKPIDLVVFSGDLVDKAGKDFDIPFSDTLNLFKTKVIDEVVKATGIPSYRFLFVGGNHEIEHELVDKKEHKIQVKIDTCQKLDNYMSFENINDKLVYMKAFIDFQRKFYEDARCDEVEISFNNFQTELKFNIEDEKVGVVLLNSSWMCYDNKDEKHIAMGVRQLNQAWPKFNECTFKLAIAHHHPVFLNDYDGTKVYSILRQHFDAYFCGHTHSQHSKYIEEADGSIFESIAAGNLYNNMHEINDSYRNGFTVLDYDLENKSVEVTPYEQKDDESFGLNYNYGQTKNGTWYFYRYEDNALTKLDEWLTKHFECSIIADKVLVPKREELIDPSYNRVILTALSGLGKTRLLHDAFNDGNVHKNCFYAKLSATNAESITRQIKEYICKIGESKGMFIIDNCTKEFHDEIYPLIPANIKLICVDNAFYDITGTSEEHLVKIEPKELRDEIKKYVSENLPLTKDNSNIFDRILYIADGYPYMAYKLVSEYHENKEVRVESADTLVPKLVNYEKEYEREQESVMVMLSLFQPFPLRKENNLAFEFILNNDILSGLSGTFIQRQKILNKVVNRFNDLLIEKTDKWINVRPFSLAVWMVGKWFSTLDEDLVEQLLGQFEELREKDERTYTLLSKSFSKRIEYMRDNPLAYELITRLNIGPTAPFANEKVVCSDLGSRLFLSMTAVNPIAVAKCLTTTLEGKNTDWLKQNIVNSSRRNLVLALEKQCFSKDSFNLGSVLMARLALAENESWANNATGQFLQLFHIFLAGTESTLYDRLNTIKGLYETPEFLPLIIKTINSAFSFGGFARMGGAETFGNEQLKDYQPSNREIWDYWKECRDILIDIVKNHSEYIEEVSNVIVNHAARWLVEGYYDMLFYPLVEVVFNAKGKDWPELYSSVRRFIRQKDLRRYNQEKSELIIAFIDSLKPSSFITELLDAQNEYFDRERKKPENTFAILEDLYRPLAHEFIVKNIFQKQDEVSKLVYNKDFIDFIFTKEVVKELDDKQLSLLFDNVFNVVKNDVENIHSPFIIKLCMESMKRLPLQQFLDKLFNEGYYNLYVSLSARCEDENLSQLKKLSSHKGDMPIDYLAIYLSCVYFEESARLFTMLDWVLKNNKDRVKDIVACLLRFRFIMRPDETKESMTFIQELLLLYPIDDKQPNTNYEYSRFVVDYLEKTNDKDFAIKMNHKIIEGFNQGYLHGNFEGIYSVLISKYRDNIWNEFSKAFVSDDYSTFWLQIHNEIGSGFGFGVGPLFMDNDDKIKQMCISYPEQAPAKLAGMIPVTSTTSQGNEVFSDLFLWILENYGEDKFVRSGLHSNMHSFSWTGSPIGLYKSFKQCLINVPKSNKEVVNQWVKDCIKEFDAEIEREQSNNDYMRMHYGYTPEG